MHHMGSASAAGAPSLGMSMEKFYTKEFYDNNKPVEVFSVGGQKSWLSKFIPRPSRPDCQWLCM